MNSKTSYSTREYLKVSEPARRPSGIEGWNADIGDFPKVVSTGASAVRGMSGQ